MLQAVFVDHSPRNLVLREYLRYVQMVDRSY